MVALLKRGLLFKCRGGGVKGLEMSKNGDRLMIATRINNYLIVCPFYMQNSRTELGFVMLSDGIVIW